MKNDQLSTQSMQLAVAVIGTVKELQSQREYIISRQLGKSGTSIGANIREAQYAHSRADFIAKMQIALKEANETDYWIELLFQSSYVDEETFRKLSNLCSSVRIMLVRSIRTAKANDENQ